MSTQLNRLVVVTGATRGLGRAMVGEFVSRKCRIIGCGRSAEQISKLQRDYGDAHHFSVVDVANDSAVQAWAQIVLEKFGPPSLLVNNAAIINKNAILWKIGAEEFDAVIDVNIKGVANVIRHFVPAMVAKKHGVIVNFSSGWGRSTDAEVGPYCETKWAIEGLSRSFAQELPSGMDCIPLNPGIINTEI